MIHIAESINPASSTQMIDEIDEDFAKTTTAKY
jgi:hypothetical protein